MTNTKGAAATFSLARGIIHTQLARQYFADAKRENIGPNARYVLGRMDQRLNATLGEMTGFMSAPSMEILRNELLPDECTQDFAALGNMYLSLPAGMKQQALQYMEGLYNTYRLNTPQQ